MDFNGAHITRICSARKRRLNYRQQWVNMFEKPGCVSVAVNGYETLKKEHIYIYIHQQMLDIDWMNLVNVGLQWVILSL